MATVAPNTARSLHSSAAHHSPTMATKNPLKAAVEVIQDRLYYVALKTKPSPEASVRRDADGKKRQIHYFCIDNELVYWNFFLDFGPLNLGQLYRFSTKLNDKLAALPNHIICFYSSTAPAKRANAVCLVCSWQVLYLNRSPEEAFHGFRLALGRSSVEYDPPTETDNASTSPLSRRANPTISPLPSFHDASPCSCTYELTVLDALRGLAKARMYGFFDFENFDVDEYEHFEQVENGDLNWIIYGKILAFAGPSYERRVSPEGYCTLSPSDYIPYFQEKKVGLVVRLNRKAYNEEDFKRAGIDHLEQFYTDGSCPPMSILDKVVGGFDGVPADKAFAVHCKAGLGRTGTCIGAWIMKHYRFTASEVIAWMRICRPGMVIGPQQQFLKEIEQRMWQLGAMEGSLNAGKKMCANFSLNCLSAANAASVSCDGDKIVATRTKKKDANDEAIVGRAGQADGLLGARSRKPKATTTSKGASGKKGTPPPSPETMKPKSKVVTPDPPGKCKSDEGGWLI